MKTALVLALLALGALLPQAASASILPTLDFTANQSIFSVAVPDLSYDYALSDRQTAGVSLSAFGSAAARTTFRLGGQTSGPAWGVTLGGGLSFLDPLAYGNPAPPSPDQAGLPYNQVNAYVLHGGPGVWLSPALVGSVPIRIAAVEFVLRGALGPGIIIGQDARNGGYMLDYGFYLMPNVELAVKFTPKSELTLLGNSIIGWRQAF